MGTSHCGNVASNVYDPKFRLIQDFKFYLRNLKIISMKKYVYGTLFLAFVGFGGLVYLLAQDCTLASYAHSFIAAFAVNFYWQQRYC